MARDSWVEGPGGRLFIRIWSPAAPAHAAPIVLLHDSLGCVELWRDFPAALCAATGRRVVAYDRLGFGQSDPYPGKLAPDFVAAEAEGGFAAVHEQLGIDRFIVLGHSVGGGMAVHAAARYGADCVALVTESAQAFVEDRTVRGIEAARDLFKDPGQRERLARYHGAKAGWVLDAWISTWLSPAFVDWSLRPVLPGVACPTLVLHGLDDEYGSVRQPETIARLASGPAQLEILAGPRHVPHRENPAQVLALLKDFMADIA